MVEWRHQIYCIWDPQMASWLQACTSVSWSLLWGSFLAAVFVNTVDLGSMLKSSASPERVYGHRVTALSRCFSDIMCTTVVVGVGMWTLTLASFFFHWETDNCTDCFNKWSGGVLFKREKDMLYDSQKTYSGSRWGCSPSGLGGSARSNARRPPGGTGSCGWADGRWSEGKLAHIHTSDSPDSWRNRSSPPRLQTKETLLDPSICLFKLCLNHIVVYHWRGSFSSGFYFGHHFDRAP